MKGFTIKTLVCAALLGAGIAFAQETAAPGPEAAEAGAAAIEAADDGADGLTIEPAPAAKEKTVLDKWWGYIEMGGATMWFLGLMAVLGLASGIERFVNCRQSRVVPDALAAQAMELWKNKKFSELTTLCGKSKSVLGRVIETFVEQRGNHDVAQVKMFAEDKAGRELRLESRRANMLSIVATISPLLGLFGTVVGLLGAFMTVAQVGEMGDPAVLADDIGKALITTVAGLIIAMPALFLYHHFRSRISLFAVLLEEEVTTLVNAWFVRKG